MCSTVQEQITTCGQNAIVKIGERTNIRPQKADIPVLPVHLMKRTQVKPKYLQVNAKLCSSHLNL